MSRVAVIYLLMISLVVGPNACCCSLHAGSDWVASSMKLVLGNHQESTTPKLRPCCRTAVAKSTSGKSKASGRVVAKSNNKHRSAGCCSGDKSCKCSGMASIPSFSTEQEHGSATTKSKQTILADNWYSSVAFDLLFPGVSPTPPAGGTPFGGPRTLSLLQRWNC